MNSEYQHTTLDGRRVWCFDASDRRHLVRTSATTVWQRAGTSPLHLSHQTLAPLERWLMVDTGLPPQPGSSWAGTGSEWCFLWWTHPSGETQEVRQVDSDASVHLFMCCVCVCVCVRVYVCERERDQTSSVKDTNSWTKLPIWLKAVMNPFTTCEWDNRFEIRFQRWTNTHRTDRHQHWYTFGVIFRHVQLSITNFDLNFLLIGTSVTYLWWVLE